VPNACRSIEVDVPPQWLMAVIVDFHGYPDFLPEVRSTRVLRTEEDAWEVEFELQVIRPVRYVLRLERQGETGLSWSLVSGLFRSNDGSWQLEALDDGARVRATYTIDVQLGVFMPGSLVNTLVGRSLNEMLEAFKARAEASRPAP